MTIALEDPCTAPDAVLPEAVFPDAVLPDALLPDAVQDRGLGVMSRQVVVDPADGRGSDRGVVPVMIVEVQPAW